MILHEFPNKCNTWGTINKEVVYIPYELLYNKGDRNVGNDIQ